MKQNKNNAWVAMIAEVVIIMLVLGLFITSAYAETARERYQNTTADYQTMKDRIMDAQRIHQESRDNFMQTRDRLNQTRTAENRVAMIEAMKNYLSRSIDYSIKYIEIFKKNAEIAEGNGYAPFKASENFAGYITDLENLRDEINNAQTREDFTAINQKLKSILQHAQYESRYFIMATANNRADVLMQRSDSITERIHDEINRMNDAGKDTAKLESLLEQYEKQLENAKNSHNAVDKLFEAHNGFDNNGVLEDAAEAREFLDSARRQMRETHSSLNEAKSVLRQIFAHLKENRPGKVDIRGTGSMTASGNGKAAISGNLEIDLSAKSGVLTVTDYEGDAQIAVTGSGDKKEIDESTTRYSGFNGSAQISGSSITVVISGDDIVLTAEGTGSAVLKGHGTYSAKSDVGQTVEGDWAPDAGSDGGEVV